MHRRHFLTLPLAAAVSPSVQGADSILPLDVCKRLLAALAPANPSYNGAFLKGLNGAVEWYFSNLALIQFSDELDQPLFEAYLNVFFAHADLVWMMAIDDFDDSGHDKVPMTADSHDAYAATLISLAVAYVRRFPTDPTVIASWNSHLRLLKSLAWTNLVAEPALTSQGLTRARRDPPAINDSPLTKCQGPIPNKPVPCPGYPVAYLLDNCEVYAALHAFGSYLDPVDSFGRVLLDARNKLGIAIHRNLFHSEPGLSRWLADDTNPFDRTDQSWYVTRVCQIFPELYGVASDNPVADQARFDAGRQFLEASKPDWWTYPQFSWNTAEKALKEEVFPWLVVGYFYATRKDPKSVVMLNNALGRYLPGQQWQPNMTIHDLAYARSIARLMKV